LAAEVKLAFEPAHRVCAAGCVVTAGTEVTAATVTTTFWVFEHPFAVSVYAYVTLTEDAVVFSNVSLIFPVPLAAALLIPVTVARLHANVVPVVLLVAVYVKAVPLVAFAVRLLDSTGVGLTVNVAALEFTVAPVFVHAALYCLLLSAVVVANDKVPEVAPLTLVHVPPPFVLTCHCTVGVGVPLAADVKLAFTPAQRVCETG